MHKQVRNQGGRREAKPTWKFFRPLKKCLGHSLKNLGPPQKTLCPLVSQADYMPVYWPKEYSVQINEIA